MYLPSHFEEKRLDVLHALIRARPLATFVTVLDGAIKVDHLPLLLAPDEGERGVLRGHIPRANPVWRALDGRAQAVAVFHGPDAYISPTWYPSKHAHGKAVPTWDYVVVQARGRPRAIDDPAWVLRHLTALVDEHEAHEPQPWKVSDAPEDYRDQLVARLVGFEMPIESIAGKWKVSQNRPTADRLGVAAGLRARGDYASLAMERLVLEGLDAAARSS